MDERYKSGNGMGTRLKLSNHGNNSNLKLGNAYIDVNCEQGEGGGYETKELSYLQVCC